MPYLVPQHKNWPDRCVAFTTRVCLHARLLSPPGKINGQATVVRQHRGELACQLSSRDLITGRRKMKGLLMDHRVGLTRGVCIQHEDIIDAIACRFSSCGKTTGRTDVLPPPWGTWVNATGIMPALVPLRQDQTRWSLYCRHMPRACAVTRRSVLLSIRQVP